MLNVNRLLIPLLFIISLTPNTLSAETQYKISEFYLGMDMKDAKLIAPCSIIPNRFKVNSMPITYLMMCKRGREEYQTVFDHNGKLYSLYKKITFSLKPDWSDIKTQLISKYGKVKLETYATHSKYFNAKYNGLCWGNCKEEAYGRDGSGSFAKRIGSNSISTQLNYNKDYETGKVENYLSISFSDEIIEKQNSNWIEEQQKKEKLSIKNNEQKLNL